jgi:hypothetical protein
MLRSSASTRRPRLIVGCRANSMCITPGICCVKWVGDVCSSFLLEKLLVTQAGREIYHLFMERKVCYLCRSSTPRGPILSRWMPVHDICFNSTISQHPCLTSNPFPSDLPNKVLNELLTFPCMWMLHTTHPPLDTLYMVSGLPRNIFSIPTALRTPYPS